ncbi:MULTISPECIES: phosphate-starvation-inducible PsiE family protein [unclassified Cupriavidus]|uniref:phosphate-starvation-inducible PsiE family protein n=1 Tax=unclassified Cupriavidus TaxID=2640874 RepID=UPI001056A38B|nr:MULTISPECIES: phosphate-starvation-inducible PsiE family protein [unclassified Cupriavidus]MBF6988917.1 phosphate-starvation-inducible PsiE family protein [Cupriavidus sp. IK-TO18]TDF66998.1 diguanylate cyclase [Cupriavidus sp. L7L]
MAAKPRTSQKLLAEMREQWRLLSLYERFEQVVAVALSLIVAVVIAIALVQLTLGVLPHVLSGTVSPLDHEVFQNLFGMVMTLLIALEFKHSIIRVALRRESIVQVKTVILISLIALSRKFVILDTKATDAATIAALSGATLVLGVVYWLLRERDDRVAGLDRGELGSE